MQNLRKFKKIISLFLCLAVVAAVMAMPSVQASTVIDISTIIEGQRGPGWRFSGHTLTVLSGANVTVTGTNDLNQPCIDPECWNCGENRENRLESPDGRRIVVAATNASPATVTLSNANIVSGGGSMVVERGAVNLNLRGTNILRVVATGFSGGDGISVLAGSLTIRGGGTLQTTGSDSSFGIRVSGTGNTRLTIGSGTITALGGNFGSGIGGGRVVIGGGNVTARGGRFGAGIWSPHVTIRGNAVVTARGGVDAAGIGGYGGLGGRVGRGGDGGKIRISGNARVTASRGAKSRSGFFFARSIGAGGGARRGFPGDVVIGANAGITTNAPVDTPPARPTATAAGNRRVRVTARATRDATRYEFQFRRTSADGRRFSRWQTVTSRNTARNLTGLTVGRVYQIRTRAVRVETDRPTVNTAWSLIRRVRVR